MASPRASLGSFLATVKKALLSPPAQRPNPLTFVVGNESADLDSICSALLLAYFRTHTPPHTLHVPLANLPRADLALRPELTAVIAPAGVKPDDLITLTDLPQDGSLDPHATRWLLVDHNALTGELAAKFSDQVIGCIDHHDDEGVIPHSMPDGQPRLLAKCGSCMSLVFEHCKPTWDRLTAEAQTATTTTSNSVSPATCDDGTPASQCDTDLARIALAAILIDTVNLTSRDKTTPCDMRAAALTTSKLSPLITTTATTTTSTTPPALGAFDPAAFHAHLVHLKDSILHLPYRDLLRKDYKRWAEGPLTLGMSTITRPLRETLAPCSDSALPAGAPHPARGRDAFLAALDSWGREQKLDVLAIMTVAHPPGGGFARELLVWGFTRAGKEVVGGFEGRFGGKLGLEGWEGGELDGEGEGWRRVCWRQRGQEFSRKQVGPMLREVMKEGAAREEGKL
ncbi:hypothetical protein C8A05DRAFT_17174 [Staphylotrichum tortipilum]|uniref:DHHA2 domain-containing protein n=1 Tax=Staphylotrichum tortipilum TaxID=2831512 RepID=A0AAN6RSI3_9PEZI|nr:hypothetical protein C8A05DRAFT_17174 [Staphylotrichum longicolle]